MTRLISEWAWGQRDENGNWMFAGVRYLSRTNTHWECWAVYGDVELEETQRVPILTSDEDLKNVADLYDLKVF